VKKLRTGNANRTFPVPDASTRVFDVVLRGQHRALIDSDAMLNLITADWVALAGRLFPASIGLPHSTYS